MVVGDGLGDEKDEATDRVVVGGLARLEVAPSIIYNSINQRL